jgi:hypothetical protein
MLLQLVTLWLTFSASESPGARRIAGIACIVVGVLDLMAIAFGMAFDFDAANLRVVALVSVVLYLIAPLRDPATPHPPPVVDVRTILGAISIYLMLGMMFAFTYRAISLYQTDPAFFGAAGSGSPPTSFSSASSR